MKISVGWNRLCAAEHGFGGQRRGSRFMKLVVNIVRRLTPRLPVRNLIFVETMEEAHALMNKRYPVEKIPFDLNHG